MLLTPIFPLIFSEDEDDFMSCLSHVKLGASLSGYFHKYKISLSCTYRIYSLWLNFFPFSLLPVEVIWGHIYDAAVVAAKEDLISVKDELKNNRTKRWQAIGMLKDVLASVNLPWQLKKHTIEFLLCIIDGNILQKYDDEHADWSSYMPSIFVALQVDSDHL